MEYGMRKNILCVSLLVFITLVLTLPVGHASALTVGSEVALPGMEYAPSQGLVTITFDDSYDNVYQNAYPILNTYGYKATTFVITGASQIVIPGHPAMPLMSLAQIQLLKARGWEIGSHTVNHVALTGLTQAQLEAEISNSKTWIVNNGLGPVYSLAYPFGDANNNVYEMAAKYYKYARTTQSGTNNYGGPNVALMCTQLYGSDTLNSLTTIKNNITLAISQNKWAIVLIHGVVTDQNDYRLNSTYGWTTTNVLSQLAQFLMSSNVHVKTFSQIEGNNPPVAVNDSYSVSGNTILTVAAPGVLGNDTDVNGDTLTATRLTNPMHGTLVFNTNGSFTYTPTTGYVGADSFTYLANDTQVNSNTATVYLTVTAVNHAPVAVIDTYSTNEDTALTMAASGVLVNDTDADGDTLTAALVNGVAHGALTLNSNGSFTYTPAANFNGSDSFTYRAYDGKAYSNTATVTITVNAVNDPPVAVNNTYSTNEDTALALAAPGVLVNDTDVDGDTLTAALIDSVAHGTLTLNSNGSFNYTPITNYNGADSFTYRAYDGKAYSIATVTIMVNAVNDPPVAVADTYSVAGNTILAVAATGVLSNDTDVDGDTLTAALVNGVAYGVLTLNSNGSFTYTPASGYVGADSFTYQAKDNTANSNTVTVSITVTSNGGTFSTFGMSGGNYEFYIGSDQVNAQRFQNTASGGTLTKLEVLLKESTPLGNIRMAVYADNNGTPGALLLETSEIAAADGWVVVEGLNLPVTQNAYYWLTFNMSRANTVVCDIGPGGSHVWINRAYAAYPATFSSIDGSNVGQFAMRATVTR
jgi:VCBS repeat-containing protein